MCKILMAYIGVTLATLHTTAFTLNATGRHVGCASVAIVAGG